MSTSKPIDASSWHMLNMWREPDGDLVVRPGIRQLYHGVESYFVILDAFTVKLADGEVMHFITVDSGSAILLVILDEAFGVFQEFTWSPTSIPITVVTHAIVHDQMLVCCPELPTLFAPLGSSVILAEKVESDNTTTTAVDVPRGICLSMCNRVAIASGRLLHFSDPIAVDGGDIRTFTGVNINQRPGVIYGLHEGGGGMFVVVTSEGVYGLDADAFAVQVVGSNGTPWRLLSHLRAFSYASSGAYRGRIYMLTQDGIAFGDTENPQPIALADPTMPRARGSRIFASDFRTARLLISEEGPIVAYPDAGAMWRLDVESGFHSWWRDWTDYPGDLRAIAAMHDGTDLYVFRDGFYVIEGDFDGTDDIVSGAVAEPIGTLFGVVPSRADENLLPRRVDLAGAVDGASRLLVAVRGSEHSATVEADPFGITLDTGAWTEGRLIPTPIANAQIDFGDVADTAATRDLAIECSFEGALVRVSPRPVVTYTDSAPRRPQAKG